MEDELAISSTDFKKLFSPLTNKKVFIFISIIGIIVYFNSLFGNFVWDDKIYMINNPDIYSYQWDKILGSSQFNDNISGFYRPISTLYFTTVYLLFQNNYFFYHVISIIFQIINSFLVFLLFKRFFDPKIAFLASFIFLIHPMQVESVSWIIQIVTLFVLFFGISAIILSQKKILSWRRISLTFTLLFLACMTKETGLILTGLTILYVALFNKKYLKMYMGLGVLTLLIYFSIRFFIGHIYFASKAARGVFVNAPMSERLLNLPAELFYYLKTFVFPEQLVSDQLWKIKSISFGSFYFPLLVDSIFILGTVFAGFYLFKNKRKLFPAFAYFWLWFFWRDVVSAKYFAFGWDCI
jgi:hypothetical protein